MKLNDYVIIPELKYYYEDDRRYDLWKIVKICDNSVCVQLVNTILTDCTHKPSTLTIPIDQIKVPYLVDFLDTKISVSGEVLRTLCANKPLVKALSDTDDIRDCREHQIRFDLHIEYFSTDYDYSHPLSVKAFYFIQDESRGLTDNFVLHRDLDKSPRISYLEIEYYKVEDYFSCDTTKERCSVKGSVLKAYYEQYLNSKSYFTDEDKFIVSLFCDSKYPPASSVYYFIKVFYKSNTIEYKLFRDLERSPRR